MTGMLQLSYVLPLRWKDGLARDELTAYLQRLRVRCKDIIIIDGSRPDVFAANELAWGSWTLHIPPDPDTACKMGKVAGVNTGLRYARHEHVVIADDDVRYEQEDLERIAMLLQNYDLVRPQNFFEPLPWHARWDTARTLLNRAVGADFPGTLAVRRTPIVEAGGYRGDVMFENLELIRTVEALGGSTTAPLDLYVRRLPASARHFWGQRTRQAYDDFAIPARMAVWLPIVPMLAALLASRRWPALAAAAAGASGLAERGRRRAGGARVFPASASVLAPLWVAERGVCSWLAVLQRVRFGGVRYGEEIIPLAAHSTSYLRSRHGQRASKRQEPSSRPRV
jgi:Glycosyl transferase family 2